MQVGALIRDSHYGLGIVTEVEPIRNVRVGLTPTQTIPSIRVFFPKMVYMKCSGHVRLVGKDQLRALKVISMG
jgi:hypothetical protein